MYARLIRWPFPILGIVSGGSAIRRQAMASGPRWSFAAAFACVVIAQEVAHGAFRSDIETDAVKQGSFRLERARGT
jgi:hypothetical protein